MFPGDKDSLQILSTLEHAAQFGVYAIPEQHRHMQVIVDLDFSNSAELLVRKSCKEVFQGIPVREHEDVSRQVEVETFTPNLSADGLDQAFYRYP